ncbi:MAG TPA: hypothetical protein VGC30_04190, partial [Dokdonella sp.]
AECELARGRRAEAAALVARARTIDAHHAALAARYREPLRRLDGALATADAPALAKAGAPPRRRRSP